MMRTRKLQQRKTGKMMRMRKEDELVHYSGYITIPDHARSQFQVCSDYGYTVNTAGIEFGQWNRHLGTASKSNT